MLNVYLDRTFRYKKTKKKLNSYFKLQFQSLKYRLRQEILFLFPFKEKKDWCIINSQWASLPSKKKGKFPVQVAGPYLMDL